MKILIVEDQKHLAEAVAQILKKQKYSVDIVHDGQSGLDFGLSNVYDLIVLDIMMPKLDGLSVLKELRKNAIQTPVLLLTAKGEVKDRIKGLDSGADDYLAKPFDKGELLARVRVLLRRKGEIIVQNEMKFGNIILNHEKLLLGNEDEVVKLTNKEADVMELLLMRKNMLTSKDLLIERLWGFDAEAEYNNVEVYISFLRKKLDYLNANIKIRTIRGSGYSLEKKSNV